MSWIDNTCDAPGRQLALSPSARQRALPFALMSKDIYAESTGSIDLAGARPRQSWIEIMQSPQEQATFSTLDKLEVQLGDAFGFNAASYALNTKTDNCLVVAFRGSHDLAKNTSKQDVEENVKSWLLTNASATFDVVNKIGEPLVDTVMRTFTPFGVFANFLNPRSAPSTQYDLADLLARAMLRVCNGVDLVLTGHSLGGGLAQYAAIRNGLRAIVFNSAGTGLTAAPAGVDDRIVRVDTTGFGVNTLVTDWSDVGSRHYGARYAIGKGGHNIDEIIRLLRQP